MILLVDKDGQRPAVVQQRITFDAAIGEFGGDPPDIHQGRAVPGGERRDGPGWFYEPTLLADVSEEMPVLNEETFGPVAALLAVRDADEAVRVANRSPYGLGAAIWTKDETAARALARRIESGSVFINGMVASDPRLPFGGVKKSGYGRELSSFGIREFVNIQTIWIGPAKQPPVVNAE